MFPFDTVLYGVWFFCHVFDVSMKYLMQWRWDGRWEKTLKTQIQEKDVRNKVSALGNNVQQEVMFKKSSCI